MPMNGTTYVNPGWRNGGPPALNAAELNAISDTLTAAQAANLSQDSLIAALQSAVSGLQTGKAQIEVGSYVGTGTYGADNPNSITCSFVPKLIWIFAYQTTDKDSNIPITVALQNSYTRRTIIVCDELKTEYTAGDAPLMSDNSFSGTRYGKMSEDRKTYSFYYSSVYAYNYSKWTYFWAALG